MQVIAATATWHRFRFYSPIGSICLRPPLNRDSVDAHLGGPFEGPAGCIGSAVGLCGPILQSNLLNPKPEEVCAELLPDALQPSSVRSFRAMVELHGRPKMRFNEVVVRNRIQLLPRKNDVHSTKSGSSARHDDHQRHLLGIMGEHL